MQSSHEMLFACLFFTLLNCPSPLERDSVALILYEITSLKEFYALETELYSIISLLWGEYMCVYMLALSLCALFLI